MVNQLTMARMNAKVPRTPVSPLNEVALLCPLWYANPAPTPPTRIRCGIARISRNAVVNRLRFVSSGSMLTDTGYGMPLIIGQVQLCDYAIRAADPPRGDCCAALNRCARR